jgi:hypothetical protein
VKLATNSTSTVLTFWVQVSVAGLFPHPVKHKTAVKTTAIDIIPFFINSSSLLWYQILG